jgi:hypothetical protein
MGTDARGFPSGDPQVPGAERDAATTRRAGGYLVSRLTLGAFQALQPLRGTRGARAGDNVGQVERTLEPAANASGWSSVHRPASSDGSCSFTESE